MSDAWRRMTSAEIGEEWRASMERARGEVLASVNRELGQLLAEGLAKPEIPWRASEAWRASMERSRGEALASVNREFDRWIADGLAKHAAIDLRERSGAPLN